MASTDISSSPSREPTRDGEPPSETDPYPLEGWVEEARNDLRDDQCESRDTRTAAEARVGVPAGTFKATLAVMSRENSE